MRRKYDFKQLGKFKYPNLVAEFMETGYSICALSECMGLGRREENDPLVKAKLFGDEAILSSEALGLSNLFGCDMEYLFDSELQMFGDYPIAYIRHFESNQREEREWEEYQMREDVRKKMMGDARLLLAVYKFVNSPEGARTHLINAILGKEKALSQPKA